MLKRFIYIVGLIMSVVSLSSCVDEMLEPDDIYGDGEALVSGEVTFKDFSTTLGGETRTPGKTLGAINSIQVFLFRPNGEILGQYKISKWATGNNTGRPDTCATTETPTVKASFSLPVPVHYGKYKMYAVANVPDSRLENISTIDDLLSIKLDWNQGKISDNNQMLGFFTTDETEGIDYDSFDAPVIGINRPQMTIYSWVRRVASKVTVAFDGRDLYENIYIYLKDVRIHNVVKSAYLGKDSKASSASDVYADGETIYYYDRSKYPNGPSTAAFNPDYKACVMKGTKHYGSDHSDEADALFFYENMQGDGNPKFQDADGDGVVDNPLGNDPNDPDYRDGKKYGTFIEVHAFYVCNVPGNMSSGDIVYRYMLGQNDSTNYDAQRNCHYKLTLHFNKYADNVDWHIDYTKPEPSIEANDGYISYLYDSSMDFSIQFNGILHPDSVIRARILENHWWPSDAPTSMYYTTEAANNTPWNGFLSLRSTGGRVDVTGPLAYNANKAFYDENDCGWRTYETKIASNQGTTADGKYTVIRNLDGREGITLICPMYTRAKNLISTTGYTGNNPYAAYRRQAIVEFSVYMRDPAQNNEFRKFSKKVNIYQVRRIVNPKGIWRNYNETKSFYVQLAHLLEAPGTDISSSNINFTVFNSNGPWSAEVIGKNTSWVKLTAGQNSYKSGNKIYGYTGTPIEFYYAPATTIGENETRCAIIKIRYHNFNCEHLIFVRQGYAPLAVVDGGTEWYSYNMRNQTERAESPLEEGSYFRWKNWSQPISPLNNKRSGYGFNISLGSKKLWLYPRTSGDTSGTTWANITGSNSAAGAWDNATIDGVSAKVATFDDYYELKKENKLVNFGFGVLYDGTSSGIQLAVKNAYGYYYNDKSVTLTDGTTEGKGMRGVFVYNKETGNQIFFPIGAAGFGRRKGRVTDGESASVGVLRYANRSKLYGDANLNMRPLFYRLYLSPGAIYFLGERYDNSDNSMGVDKGMQYAWDMNYDTFNFNGFSNNVNAGSGSDACYVRCVKSSSSSGAKRKNNLSRTSHKRRK